MIKLETVLTATPIALERLPQDMDLAEKAGPLVQGLNQSVMSLEGYTLTNVATELPKNTEGDTEHTALVETSAESIASVIRASLSAISGYVIPACDTLEKYLRDCPNKNGTIDYVFGSLTVNPVYLNTSLLNSPALQVDVDPEYGSGVSFDVSSMNMGSWPELTGPEICNLCKEALNYPEIVDVFGDEDTVKSAYSAIFTKPYWLYRNQASVTLSSVNMEIGDIFKLIVLNIILFKLDSQEGPLEGVDGISLDDYRSNIRRQKRFAKSMLARMKNVLSSLASRGVEVVGADKVTYKKITDDYAPLKGAVAFEGSVSVVYTTEMAEYFENSDSASLTEVALGIIIAKEKNIFVKGDGVVDRIPAYMELANDYISSVHLAMTENIRSYATRAVNDAMVSIANQPNWREFLDGVEGAGSAVGKLQSGLNKAGGYLELLTSPTFVAKIIEGQARVASTVIGVRMAEVLGAPIAARILQANIDEDCSCVEKQRKALSKAIVRVVLETLMK